MEISDEDMAFGAADPRQFAIGGQGVGEMAEHQPAPHHVEMCGREWESADIGHHKVRGVAGGYHLGTGIYANRVCDLGNPSACATSGVQQALPRQSGQHLVRQLVVQET
jgi:hypothetical protein